MSAFPQALVLSALSDTLRAQSEVVLSILLETFRFSPSKREIDWLMNGIVTPTLKGDVTESPYLPIKVALVQPSSKQGAE